MTAADLWQDVEAEENIFTKFFRLVFLLVAAVVLYFFAVLPLMWPQQVVLGFIILVLSMVLARSSDSYLITLALMMISMFCTFRYGYWRITTTVQFFRDPASHWGALDAFFIVTLLLAEVYAFAVLLLGYFQTLWPLRRAPVALPDAIKEWPHVDVLIPTYNESLDVVRYTALGALNMDWPADRMHVYILDDGRRKEFEHFAFEAGIGYKTRSDNKHAKAGNINAALKSMRSPFVVIFDSDQVPTRSFLQMTMGWMLRDAKLAMLQTPHHLYSPDPFERNLRQFHVIPNEGEMFYGVVQDGNDFWNSTFFCGSGAVLRRKALDEVGGMAVETVTEDAHTSLRMQMRGWGTAYINIPQAAGLATERLSAHIGQRIRWARGMIQILRIENPLLAPGLRLPQRLCYFNAMSHFLYAIPRLIFLCAPLIFLLFNHTNILGYWAAILAYALPHLALSSVANSRIQGEHRHSFWNEIYETVLSPYILLPTMMALINPRLGKFNVTAKGGVVKKTFFDSRIAKPFLILLLLNIAGLIVAIPRFLIWDRGQHGTVLMNVIWCFFNVIILGVCVAVARELRQLRTSVRINVATSVVARMPEGPPISGQTNETATPHEGTTPNGRPLHAETIDMSSGGASIRFPEAVDLLPNTQVWLSFPHPAPSTEIPASVVSSEGSVLRLRFEDLTIAEQEVLAIVLYSRADSWLGYGEPQKNDNLMRSMGRIFMISMRGLGATFKSLFGSEDDKVRKTASLSIVRSALIFALGTALISAMPSAKGQTRPQPSAPGSSQQASSQASSQPPSKAQPVVETQQLSLTQGSALPPPPPGQFRDLFTLADAGSPQIELHGIDSSRTVKFALTQTHVVRTANIHISYAFSPSLLPQLSQIKLIMNGTLFATIQPKPGETGGSDSSDAEAEFTIPPELLVHDNALTIEFIGHYSMTCEDPSNTVLWSRVHRNTTFEFEGDLLPLADDVKQLPLPFLDPAAIKSSAIPIVFESAPSLKAIQAAGVVASYFGLVSESRPVRFPIFVGTMPQGNAIVIAENATNLPSGVDLPAVTGPIVAMRSNPNDPYGKILIVAGLNADELLVAAQAVAMHGDLLSGAQAPIAAFKLPEKQRPDAAPRWARTDQTVALGDYATAEQLQGDGTWPLNVNFRIPPDLYYNAREPNAILKLAYRYNSIPIGPLSSMQVRVNNAYVDSVPLTPGQEDARKTEKDLAVPVVNLRPFSNSLSFDFAFQLVKKQGCEDTTPINLQGAILRDSYLDLRGYPHYAPLPNLEIFSNAGFPFTRLADLSETTVVLPPQPTVQEIETFVTLMGHFGRQTGFPALRITVAGSDALMQGADSDFIVIGTGDDQPGFDKINNSLPVAVSSGKIQVRDTQGFFVKILHNAWWKLRSDEHAESGDLTADGVPDSIIEGIKSPFVPTGDRSIVVIHLKDSSAFEPFMATFLQVQQSSDIAGSVAVLHGSQFQSFRIGSEVYHVGVLPWWSWLRLSLWFMQYPWVAAVIIFVLALLLAVLMRHWLRRRARIRLNIIER
jgi:cellulose synthase (UDP-forming)